MRILAVIPARKGSKRLPGKNTKLLCGRPLIEYSIEKAIRAGAVYAYTGNILDICVSTDDAEVKKIASNYKGIAVRDRPKELASDTAPSVVVLQDAVRWYEGQGFFHDYVILLQATSPLRTSDDISNSLKQIVGSTHWESLVSLYEHDEMTFAKNGAIYVVRTQLLMEEGKLHGEHKYLFNTDKGVDIDTEKDFKDAENFLSKLQPSI